MNIDRDFRIFTAFMVFLILVIVGFGIFVGTGGLGPSKRERIERLEQRTDDLEARVKVLEQK